MKKSYNIKTLNNLSLSKKKKQYIFFKKLIDNNTKLPLNLRLAILFSSSNFSLKVFFSKISFSKFKSQCLLTWRTHSVYSFFSLSRMAIRELSSFGFMKGIKKSSW